MRFLIQLFRFPIERPLYIYIYRFLYDYIGKHIHLINSITGMNRLKINIVIITVFLDLHLAHYLIGFCFLQGSLPDTQCVLKSKRSFSNLFTLEMFWLSWLKFIMGFLSWSREITWQYPTLVNSSFLSYSLHCFRCYCSVTQHLTVSLNKWYISEKSGTSKDTS